MDSEVDPEVEGLGAKHPGFFARIATSPEGYLVGTFAGLILVGTILLTLPIAHRGANVGPLDALFTSTSAVCVTGLIVVDTEHDFSRFGQVVILCLIQVGGLGIMTFGALLLQLAGHKISLRSQAALQDVFYQRSAATLFEKNLRWIVVITLVMEAIGALVLLASLDPQIHGNEAVFVAVFHAVSAFCNAGFSTFSANLAAVRDNPAFLTTIGLLVILGGLGYTVLLELMQRAWALVSRRRLPIKWSLNTRVVLVMSVFLLFAGALGIALLGMGGEAPLLRRRTAAAIFHSITARTAGFNTVDLAALPSCTLLWIAFLMFVGGSPGSCAGGVKTTSLGIWLARLKARLRHSNDVTIADRRIPVDVVRRTGLLVAVAAIFNMLGILFLSVTEMGRADHEMRLEQIIFEQISAFGTVGLSTGITPYLTIAGKLWVILTMFVGRLGPLTIGLLVLEREEALVRLPEERIMIG